MIGTRCASGWKRSPANGSRRWKRIEPAPEKAKPREAAWDADYGLSREHTEPATREQDQAPTPQVEKVHAPKRIEHDLGL